MLLVSETLVAVLAPEASNCVVISTHTLSDSLALLFINII